MNEKARHHLRVVKGQHGGDLENACGHCGACCHPSVPINGRLVLVKGVRCKFLRFDGDGQSRCGVYAERHRRAPWCQKLERGIDTRIFPGLCPYVKGLEGYRGPEVLDAVRYRLVEDQIIAALKAWGLQPWADPAEWNAYVNGAIR